MCTVDMDAQSVMESMTVMLIAAFTIQRMQR